MASLSASSLLKRVGIARPIPVYVINESPIFVMALTDFLHETSEVRVVGSAVQLAEGLAAAREAQPKVVLIDPGFEAEAIVEAIRDVKAVLPSAGLLVLAAHYEEEARRAALAVGADAYISEWAPGDHLIGPIRHCARRQPTAMNRIRA